MNKALTLLLFLSAIVNICFCQTDSVNNKRKERRNFFNDTIYAKGKAIIGYYSEAAGVTSSFAELNNIITSLGYPYLTNDYGEASFGFSKRNRNRTSYISTKVSFIFSESSRRNTNNPKDVRLRGWSILWTVNPNLVNHPKWLVYPYFGFGFGSSSLTLFDNLNYQSFGTSAANLAAPTSKSWTAFSFKYELGAGFERKLRVWVYDFYTGFSGGYSFRSANYFLDNYGSFNNRAPVGLNGWTLSWRLRFELWRQPVFGKK